ncbi:MAG TPA: 4Fe-4S binding protein [Candidatus Brocadiia bacterium]|nr:4Fe-4S binding protein [Candidatus Brocadiia bacterium]
MQTASENAMAHIVNPQKEYRLLQQRLDRNVSGAPDSPAFMKILEMLFTPEEANIMRRLPSKPTRMDILAQKLGMPENELADKLTEMARRGLVFDFERKGRRYCSQVPVVIGFFEFTYMRTREDLPMTELSRLFTEYMEREDKFARAVFKGETQMGRSLVREEALPEDDHTEILDYERASRIIKDAGTVGVSLCACRHKKSHLGEACDAPMEVCMTLGKSAAIMAKHGLTRLIAPDEAMKVLDQCKAANLAQTGDNVKRKLTYICNCCGCCCGMMQAIRMFDIRNAIVTSNWVMQVDEEKCRACGKCVKVCPARAIDLAAPKSRIALPPGADSEPSNGEEAGKSARKACVDETLCLGCGVCYSSCKFGAISMRSRPQRVHTPETLFDQMISMAIERGKLSNLLFDEPEKLSHRALGRIVSVVEKSPPFKAAMAVKPLKSAFMNALVSGAKKATGDLF